MKLRDKLWLWGQTPHLHHMYDNYALPGVNQMTAFEGAMYFGLPNVCRVTMGGWPAVPFEQEAMVLDGMKSVVWGVGATDMEMQDEVINMANTHPNVKAAILDDFFSDGSLKKQPPSAIAELRRKLHEGPERPIELWSVIYCTELFENRIPYIKECDAITFWTIDGKLLPGLEKNFEKLKTLTGDLPIYCGCYMWDYHGKRHMPLSLMKYQLDVMYGWLKSGQIEGIIFCSNCIGDMGLEAVSYTRAWIAEHGDEEI
ncbi:MAG: hypothetical protein IKM07_05560 [Clostridia bacterium]|nr:hypothetical protein [Oscillospiraceae bacterium]MBR6748388.1 hypothetical protein [Clostridia bacterium]